MSKLRTALIALVPIATLSLTPISPALAHGHGFEHGRGFGHGFGRGPGGAVAALVGAAAAIVTAPLWLASAAIDAAPAPA